mgnify:CR=1 FL=1
MSNTAIQYCYRDASNYKQWERVVIAGEIGRKDFTPVLRRQEFFVPTEVGLDGLQSRFDDWPTADDHDWHVLEDVTPTDEPPTVTLTAADIRHALRRHGEAVLTPDAGVLATEDAGKVSCKK